MNNNIRIDYAKKLVRISRAYEVAARDLNSPEHRKLMEFNGAGFTIEVKTARVNKRKVKHKGLTVKWMERFLISHKDRRYFIKDFYDTKARYEGHPHYYAEMKRWFFNYFPELKATTKRKKYAALTLDFMDNFVDRQDNCDVLIPKYEKVKEIYEEHQEYYARLKEWFVGQFPSLSVEEIMMERQAETEMIMLLEELEAQKDNALDDTPNEEVVNEIETEQTETEDEKKIA
jgi:hypothetical protein